MARHRKRLARGLAHEPRNILGVPVGGPAGDSVASFAFWPPRRSPRFVLPPCSLMGARYGWPPTWPNQGSGNGTTFLTNEIARMQGPQSSAMMLQAAHVRSAMTPPLTRTRSGRLSRLQVARAGVEIAAQPVRLWVNGLRPRKLVGDGSAGKTDALPWERKRAARPIGGKSWKRWCRNYSVFKSVAVLS
jgi:hypothetical protein